MFVTYLCEDVLRWRSGREMDGLPKRLPTTTRRRDTGDEVSFMAGPQAVLALAALGQSTRLEVFRLLMQHEPTGLTAGAIAASIGCPQNTLSSHISVLARAGLVSGTRDGRSINYRADVEGMHRLLGFLVTDCCGGHPELCGFLEASTEKEHGSSSNLTTSSKQSCGCRARAE